MNLLPKGRPLPTTVDTAGVVLVSQEQQIMAAIVDEEPADFYFQDDLYLEHPDDKFSCPICLCPVQRDAYLTECCGNHFCLCCIRRLRNERKPCPICKSPSLAIFPNKERQREIKQLRIRCPLSLTAFQNLLSGRGREGSRETSDESSAVDYLKIDESSAAANQSGFHNALETATLSKALEKCEIVDNVSTNPGTKEPTRTCTTVRVNKQTTGNGFMKCTEHTTSASKVEPGNESTLEDFTEERGDLVKDSGMTRCNWTGELGKVEQHILDTHGREVLSRIKSEDELQPVVQQQCPVHGQHGHHGHVRNPHNVTFHYVHSPRGGGMALHYHVNRSSSSFNSSAAAPTAPSSVLSTFHGNQPPVHRSRQLQQSNEVPHSSDLVDTMQHSGNSRSAQNQSCHDSRPISTLASPTSGQIQGPVSARGGEVPDSERQVNSGGNAQGDGTLPATQEPVVAGEQQQYEQQQQQQHRVGGNTVVDGQSPPRPVSAHNGQFLYQQHPRPMFVRRSCPHNHVRGVRGHHMRPHRHHFHHHPPHHDAPPPPHDLSHGSSHGQPYYGPPPHGHHPPHGRRHHHHIHPHRHHHHPHGHHGCHGHHPPP